MPAGITRRTGALTEQALLDAIGSERDAGRRPYVVAVGSTVLEARALAILTHATVPADDLRAAMPRVRYDPALSLDAWELREEAEDRATYFPPAGGA